MHKTCTKCGETKPLDDFYDASTGQKQSRCKACYAVLVRRWYLTNKPKVNAAQNERRRRERERERRWVE